MILRDAGTSPVGHRRFSWCHGKREIERYDDKAFFGFPRSMSWNFKHRTCGFGLQGRGIGVRRPVQGNALETEQSNPTDVEL
jgi:hypothetical protein